MTTIYCMDEFQSLEDADRVMLANEDKLTPRLQKLLCANISDEQVAGQEAAYIDDVRNELRHLLLDADVSVARIEELLEHEFVTSECLFI